MAPGEDVDSGMESLTSSSKDLTPEKLNDPQGVEDPFGNVVEAQRMEGSFGNSELQQQQRMEGSFGNLDMQPTEGPFEKMDQQLMMDDSFGKESQQELEESFPDDIPEENEIEETFTERLMGLSEMFPESVRNLSYNVATNTVTGLKGLYSITRTASWVFFSSSVILFAPIIFEVERAQMEEMQRQQQRQILLGPNAAMSGAATPGASALVPPTSPR